MNKGKLIVFEGINGCGKDTQLKMFHNYLLDLGKAVPIFTTGEPNDFDSNGRRAREILSSDGDPYSNNVEAANAFAQNRRNHNCIFLPLLEAGINVLSSRYWHSNFAFQHAQKIPYDEIARLNMELRVPDLTYVFDVPASLAAERLEKRIGVDEDKAKLIGDDRRKFDKNLGFLEQVRQNYLELPRILPDLINDRSIIVIDGTRGIEDIFDEIKITYARIRQ